MIARMVESWHRARWFARLRRERIDTRLRFPDKKNRDGFRWLAVFRK